MKFSCDRLSTDRERIARGLRGEFRELRYQDRRARVMIEALRGIRRNGLFGERNGRGEGKKRLRPYRKSRENVPLLRGAAKEMEGGEGRRQQRGLYVIPIETTKEAKIIDNPRVGLSTNLRSEHRKRLLTESSSKRERKRARSIT